MAARKEVGALPGVAGDEHLGSLAGFEIGAQHGDLVGGVGMEVSISTGSPG